MCVVCATCLGWVAGRRGNCSCVCTFARISGGGGVKSLTKALLGLAALVAVVVALDFPQPAQAQSGGQTGRIIARCTIALAVAIIAASCGSAPLAIAEFTLWCAERDAEDERFGERLESGAMTWGEFADGIKQFADDLNALNLPDALIDWRTVQLAASDGLIEIAKNYDRDDLVLLTTTTEDARTLGRLAQVADTASDSLRDRLSDYDYQLLRDGGCFE